MNNQPACTALTIELTAADLPVACPPRDDRVWDAHPRVYLTLNAQGQVTCPYCSTTYVLKTPGKAH